MTDPDRIHIPTATRDELATYLEQRGFAVFAWEPAEDLRVAALADMETRDTGSFDKEES